MDTTAIATRDTTVAARPGYDPTPVRTVARVRPMLDEERVVWLSTVRPDGTPHLVPTWFWWDGEALVVFSKPGAAKVRNLRANPRLMVAVGDPEDDFSVGLIEAEATCHDEAAVIPDAFFAKYATELGPGRLDAGCLPRDVHPGRSASSRRATSSGTAAARRTTRCPCRSRQGRSAGGRPSVRASRPSSPGPARASRPPSSHPAR